MQRRKLGTFLASFPIHARISTLGRIDWRTPLLYPHFRRSEWRITRRVLRRIRQVTLASSRISCGAWLLYRILKSKLSLTPRSGRRSGRRLLPALPAQGIRRPFLPPCQSLLHRSVASLQSARVPALNDPHCPCPSGCC